jgi:Xaa-Pro aminopeptidase
VTDVRISRLRAILKQQEIDTVLISQPDNRYYLSGFDGSDGYLLITQNEKIVATDFRYTEQVKKQSPNFILFEIKGRFADWFTAFLEGRSIHRLAFESAVVTVSLYKHISDILADKFPDIQLVPVENLVENLRGIKAPEEIEKIARAVQISDLAIDTITANLKPGITERELAWRLERFMRESGSGVMPFEVIVAAGENGAMAHHSPSDRPIAAGEPMVIDMGARFDHYCSDLTRTICLGKSNSQFEKIYEIVLRAQKAAINGIVSGMSGVQADALAREVINAAGYEDKFGHGLGHGVGLNVHDMIPRLSPLAPPDPLVNGMVFSIEPGIYVPEWGGVRIEDLAVLENGKVKLLSHARK